MLDNRFIFRNYKVNENHFSNKSYIYINLILKVTYFLNNKIFE